MNPVDYIVVSVIAAVFVMCALYLVRRTKQNGGACGRCANCSRNCAGRNPDVTR